MGHFHSLGRAMEARSRLIPSKVRTGKSITANFEQCHQSVEWTGLLAPKKVCVSASSSDRSARRGAVCK